MKNNYFLIPVLCLVISLTSCSKDDETTLTMSNKEMLTSKSWVVSAKTVSPSISMGGLEVSNILSLESEEVKNYSFKYNNDNTLFMYDYLNSLIFQSTWSINADQTHVIHLQPIIYTYPIVGDISITAFTIESITTKQMVAIIPFQYEGINYVVTITFI